MSASTGPRAGGRERHVDRSALPDPSLWVKSESPHGHAIRRLALSSGLAEQILAILILGRISARRAFICRTAFS